MLTLSAVTRVFVFSEPTDMRKSFNGLSGLVREHFEVDLLSGHLFLFFNHRRDSVKILAWDKDGLAIWYKRLEAGSFQIPGSSQSSLEIDHAQLAMLLSGIDLASAKRRKRYRAA
jgi:transposase